MSKTIIAIIAIILDAATPFLFVGFGKRFGANFSQRGFRGIEITDHESASLQEINEKFLSLHRIVKHRDTLRILFVARAIVNGLIVVVSSPLPTRGERHLAVYRALYFTVRVQIDRNAIFFPRRSSSRARQTYTVEFRPRNKITAASPPSSPHSSGGGASKESEGGFLSIDTKGRRGEEVRIEPDRARALDILQATPMSVSAARVNPPLEHRAEPSRESSHGHVPDARTEPGDRLINFFVPVESAHLDQSSSPDPI